MRNRKGRNYVLVLLLLFVLVGVAGPLICRFRETSELISVVSAGGGQVETIPWGRRESWPLIGAVPKSVPRRIIAISTGSSTETEAWLSRIDGETSLEELSLHDPNLDDSDLVHLRNLTNLQELRLDGTSVTGVGFEHLRNLQALQVLDLSGTEVTDDALAHIRHLPQLQELWLTDTPRIGDEGIGYVAELPSLEILVGIGWNQVSNRGLNALTRCRQLRHIHVFVDGERITADGVKQLQKAIPQCEIVY